MRNTGFPERLRFGVPGADHHPFAETGLIGAAWGGVKLGECARMKLQM
jgi:hypothetical protein